MTPTVRLELTGSLKRRVEDVEIQIPKSTAIRQDLHAVRRAAGYNPPMSPEAAANADSARGRHAAESLYYEVLETTTMLLFVLSSIAVGPPKHYRSTAQATDILLPGLPEICLNPSIYTCPGDEPYASTDTAAQMAYTGWIASVFALWENRFRREWEAAVGEGAIPPEYDAFGDLRLIRNDLLHNNATASAERSGKCETLKWFSPGDRMVFGTRHVLDFLNQAGLLSLGGTAHETTSGRGCVFRALFDRERLSDWTPRPELVSVRTHDNGREHDPPFKGVTVVFSNGLFANLPFRLTSEHQWEALGKARIGRAGDLEFANGTVVGSRRIYKQAVDAQEPGKPGDGRPRSPVAGPWVRIRR